LKADIRAVTAFVAGCSILEVRALKVFDYSQSKHIHFSPIVIDRTQVSVYLHDGNCHFSGTSSGDRFSLFHNGQLHFVDLQLTGNSFIGYDYGSKSHFSGAVNGSIISIVDFGAGDYFRYSI
jgi:hypothetical protein